MRDLLRVCWLTSLIGVLAMLINAVMPESRNANLLLIGTSVLMSLDFTILSH